MRHSEIDPKKRWCPLKIEYEIWITVDGAKALAPVGVLQRQLNTHLSSMGVAERIGFSSRMRIGMITMTRDRDEGELEQMRTLIHAQLLESSLSYAKAITKVELLRRQSGHVLQSAP